MEKIISEMIISGNECIENEITSKDEEEQIRKELTKLGYM